MITVTHPSVSEGTVEVSGLTFVDGKVDVSNIDDAARAVLTDHGFTFDGEPEPDAADEQKVDAPTKAWNKDRLIEWAAEHSIDISEAKTKDDILDRVRRCCREHRGRRAEGRCGVLTRPVARAVRCAGHSPSLTDRRRVVRIFHPRPQIGRQQFIGVEFRGGVAEVDELHPERLVALEQHGFLIQFDDGSVSAPGDWLLPLPEPLSAPSEPTPLADLTVSELREIADFEGVEVPKGAKKADIIAALERGKHVTITIDGEPNDVPAAVALTPRAVLNIVELEADRYEVRVLGELGLPTEFDETTPHHGQEFITFRTAATD